MLSPLLQDRADAYVSGAMSAAERENFELVLEFHEELRGHVAGLQEGIATSALAGLHKLVEPRAALKARLLRSAASQPRQAEAEGLVVTDRHGLVQWVNPAFTAMCGFSVEELKGRKPGEMLQGAATDRAAVGRLRAAFQARRPCRETLVNYHKDGTPYHVEIRLEPVLDDEREPLWFVARERKLPADDSLLVG